MSHDWPAGVGREICPALDSTSAELLRRAGQGMRGPLWLLAHRQSAARGRRGRAWDMPAGNFAAPFLQSLDEPPGARALRSFVAALGLRDALVAATGAPAAFALKWPNDVLLHGRKLAGILLETGGVAGAALVTGIGVNLRAAPTPPELEPGALPAASLCPALGVEIAPEAFLDLLAPRVAAWEGRLVRDGFAPVRAAWLAGAARLGEPIEARLPDRRLGGIFETIDPAGALVLGTARGRVTLPAAEVHFPADPPMERERRHASGD